MRVLASAGGVAVVVRTLRLAVEFPLTCSDGIIESTEPDGREAVVPPRTRRLCLLILRFAHARVDLASGNNMQ